MLVRIAGELVVEASIHVMELRVCHLSDDSSEDQSKVYFGNWIDGLFVRPRDCFPLPLSLIRDQLLFCILFML